MKAMGQTKLAFPMEKTPWQRAKEERDRNMSREYDRLFEEKPGRSRVEVNKYLMDKYGLASVSAYYAALERGRAHRKEEGQP